MILREYQKDLVRQIYESWQRGNKNVGVQLHTGGGKTCIFSYILAHHPGGAIAIAHRVELVSQISLTLARYNIAHNIIAQKQSIREIIALHHDEVGRSFYKSTSNIVVAGIDTLLRLSADTPWFKSISLVVQDEGHHPLKKNKWGRAAELFSNAYGLYPTATPCRADGNGLGRHSDGILDDLIVGIPMRQLIHDGFLTDYRIFAPPNDLDLSNVPVGSTGDFSFDPLRKAVHKSQITGDIVKHYLKIAPGKLGVTFAVDVDAAVEIKTAFCAAGIKAELITGKTPATLRANIMRRFRNEEIKQIVNVDILGEGVDVPAIEVVSMARPTESYGLYSQSFGRALRPKNSKKHALIIDHVGNVLRHGLPDAPRIWTLDRREKRSRSKQNDEILLISCVECFSVYKRVLRSCPFCDYVPVPTNRSAPEYVDGDLNELSSEILAKLRGEISAILDPPRVNPHIPPIAQQTQIKRHRDRKIVQQELRDLIAQWAGYLKHTNKSDSFIYRSFYFKFKIDVANAQLLNATDASELMLQIKKDIDVLVNEGVL